MKQCEIILKVAAAGGSIILYGKPAAEGWLFSRHVIDFTPSLLSEACITHDTEVVNNWLSALNLMDRYRWHRLLPISVHPDFRHATLSAVESRFKSENRVDADRLSEWIEVCSIPRLST